MLVDRPRALLRVGQKANLTLHLYPFPKGLFFSERISFVFVSMSSSRHVNSFVYIFLVRQSVLRMSGHSHRTDFPEHFNSCTL